MAKALKMIHAKLISSADIYFDFRTMLKFRCGREDPLTCQLLYPRLTA